MQAADIAKLIEENVRRYIDKKSLFQYKGCELVVKNRRKLKLKSCWLVVTFGRYSNAKIGRSYNFKIRHTDKKLFSSRHQTGHNWTRTMLLCLQTS